MATSTLSSSSPRSASDPELEFRQIAASAKFNSDDVLTRAQSGDHEAFSMLYLQHKKRVFSICMRMVRDFPVAEDLTQETFLQLHRKLTSFRGDSSFITWLHRMTVNIVLVHLRKRVLPVISLDHLLENLPEERGRPSFGTRDLTQAGVVDRIAISRAIAALPPGYQDIFILHDVRGFLHDDIALMQDCTLGNSKSQLSKARRALRSALSTQPGSAIAAVKDASVRAIPKSKRIPKTKRSWQCPPAIYCDGTSERV
jgi:RNA polymerase sigma-70 factor (ECF subfamily)